MTTTAMLCVPHAMQLVDTSITQSNPKDTSNTTEVTQQPPSPVSTDPEPSLSLIESSSAPPIVPLPTTTTTTSSSTIVAPRIRRPRWYTVTHLVVLALRSLQPQYTTLNTNNPTTIDDTTTTTTAAAVPLHDLDVAVVREDRALAESIGCPPLIALRKDRNLLLADTLRNASHGYWSLNPIPMPLRSTNNTTSSYTTAYTTTTSVSGDKDEPSIIVNTSEPMDVILDPLTRVTLLFVPGSFDDAIRNYDQWTKQLVAHDWPYLFSMKRPWLERGGDDFVCDSTDDEYRVLYKRLRKVARLRPRYRSRRPPSKIAQHYLDLIPNRYADEWLLEQRDLARERRRIRREAELYTDSELDESDTPSLSTTKTEDVATIDNTEGAAEQGANASIDNVPVESGRRVSRRIQQKTSRIMCYRDVIKVSLTGKAPTTDSSVLRCQSRKCPIESMIPTSSTAVSLDNSGSTHHQGSVKSESDELKIVGTETNCGIQPGKIRRGMVCDGIPLHKRKFDDGANDYIGEFQPLRIDSVPTCLDDLFEVRESTIPNAGLGLFAKRYIPANTALGFYFGVPTLENEFDAYKAKVGRASEYVHKYRTMVIDATDATGEPYRREQVHCPFHYMNENVACQNVVYQEGSQLHQIICTTLCDVEQGNELFANYGREMARNWVVTPKPRGATPMSTSTSTPMNICGDIPTSHTNLDNGVEDASTSAS